MAHICHKPGHAFNEYDVEEFCQTCGDYIAVTVDMEEKHLQTTCPVCGRMMMICSMCENRCDWKDGDGCHMDIEHREKVDTAVDITVQSEKDEPVQQYAIWYNHKVVGHAFLKPSMKDVLNAKNRTPVYYGKFPAQKMEDE